MAFGPHRARNGMRFESADQAYAAGYDTIYQVLWGDATDPAYLASVEAQCERQKANTLVPYIYDYWRGQVAHLSEKLAREGSK